MAGKAASGVAMATLRCISKLVMPPTKEGLQHSTGIYSAAAALLVLVCAGIVAWVLPRMQQTMAELRQHSGEWAMELTLTGVHHRAGAHWNACSKQPVHGQIIRMCPIPSQQSAGTCSATILPMVPACFAAHACRHHC
jgi:cytochrome bd-type quinol oxidase subunit 2